MEIIKEAYYLQIVLVFVLFLDIVGQLIPFLSFLSISIFITGLAQIHFKVYIYSFTFYNLLHQIPRISAYFYIIKNKETIKEYSKYLIYYSYLMLGLIFLSFITSILITFYPFESRFSNFTSFVNILITLENFLFYGSIILILLISNFKNLKNAKIWMVIHYLIGIAIVFYFRVGLRDLEILGYITFFSNFVHSTILILMIRSIYLFAKNDIKLISE